MTGVAGNKRTIRSASNDALLKLDGELQQSVKRQETGEHEPSALEHLLPPFPAESKAAYFRRLGARLCRDVFSPASSFDRDGIYIYKRPVRSGSGDKAALLAAGGSVFHHCVVYIKAGDDLTALEFGPANAMDITDNMMAEVPAAPVVRRPAPAPEAACLPMLHVAAPHHPLDAEHVQAALASVEEMAYHAIKSNCIGFADCIVRVLTGGAVKCAPLIFDLLVGQVPPVDSPLLLLLGMTTGLRWHDVADGARMLAALLQRHPQAVLPVPGCSEQLSLLLPEPAVPSDVPQHAAQQQAMQQAAALPGLPGPLAALLASSGVQLPAQLPAQTTGSSASSDDACRVEPDDVGNSSAPSASMAALHAVASGSSLASTGTNQSVPPKGGVKGLGLPPRRAA